MKLLLITILFSLHLCLNAQSDTWRTDDGLSNEWISDIVQDDDGYLWIATQYGLNRFDGYEFETLNYAPNDSNSISSNWVRHIVKNSLGQIYLNCYYADLHILDPKTKKLSLIKKDPNRNLSFIRKLIIDQKDQLWAGGPAGLFKLNKGEKRLSFVADYNIKDIEVLKNGNLLILTQDDAILLDEQLVAKKVILENKALREIFVDKRQDLWALTNNALLQIDQSTWKSTAFPLEEIILNRPRTFSGTALYEDSKNQIWVAGENGLAIIDGTTKQQRFLPIESINLQGVHGLYILKIFEDKDLNIWLGTDQGLIMISKLHTRFGIPKIDQALRGIPGVRDIYMDDTTIYIATETGLFIRRTTDDTHAITPNFDEAVYSVYLSKTRDLYLGGHHQVYVQKNGDRQFSKIENKEFPGGITWDIIEDKLGHIWFASLDGLSRYDPITKDMIAFTNKNQSQLNSSISQGLIIDQNGELWGGTLTDGVYRLKNTSDLKNAEDVKFINYGYNPTDTASLSSNLVTSLALGPDGTVWVGTDGGLNRISQSGKIKRYLKQDGLNDDKFMKLQIDNNNVLWGSTIGHGIMAMDINKNSTTFFDKSDGLNSNNFLLNSGFKSKSGILLFGSDAGVQSIDAKKALSLSPTTTDFEFTEIEISSSKNHPSRTISIDTEEAIEIPYDQAFFNLSFTTVQYFKPTKTQYSYRILPVQNFWQSNGSSREINFNGLKEGNYTVEVKATNPMLRVVPKTIKLDIKILPPWWRTKLSYLFYGLILLSILYLLYKRQQEILEAKRLKEMNELKTKLYTNITHEIRTPLTVILGISKKLMGDSKKAVAASAEIINRNGSHLLLLVNRILDLSKIESGKMQINLVQQDIIPYLSYLLESFQSWAEDRDIRIHLLSDEDHLLMDFDQEIMKQIINNLMSNAIKYSPLGGDIYWHINKVNGNLELSIKDTGTGIDPAKISHLFERFYQEEAAQNSSGIGLAVTKELTEILGGNISVKNNIKKGCTFTIVIPISNSAPEIDNSSSYSNDISEFSEELDKVLIIEDNIDVLNFIQDCLQGQYEIIKAINGKDGMTIALEVIPDIIISDVMMPLMDGYEVCQKLKKDPRTNHIPIILLTAKADDASKLVGLEHGADEYLIKPFDAKELELRISNILTLRRNFRESVGATLLNDKHGFSHQDPFVTELIQLIDDNLQNAQFGIPQICRNLGISRVHLHRKLKALTDQSTSIFIRNIRLTRAHSMLQNSDKNISEVAYDVGFKDPAYFSKVYTERYKQSPSKTKHA